MFLGCSPHVKIVVFFIATFSTYANVTDIFGFYRFCVASKN